MGNELKKFLDQTFHPDPDKRLGGAGVPKASAKALREHPWFHGFSWASLAAGDEGPHKAQVAADLKLKLARGVPKQTPKDRAAAAPTTPRARRPSQQLSSEDAWDLLVPRAGDGCPRHPREALGV